LTDHNAELSGAATNPSPPLNCESQRKDHFVDLKLSHWVEIVLTLALVVIAGLQYAVYNRQAGIMEAQDQTMKAAQRPWMSVGNPHAVNGFPVGDGGGAFVVEFNFKNFGNSPALNVEIDAELPMVKSNLGFLAKQEAICKRLKERPIGDRGNGLTIFPQESIPQRLSVSIQPGTVSEGINGLKMPPTPTPNHLFAPLLIGCMRYVYSADMSQHETGFVFDVMHLPPNGLLSADKGDIPAQEILLINPQSGGSRTN
jgi:hypothetical protein